MLNAARLPLVTAKARVGNNSRFLVGAKGYTIFIKNLFSNGRVEGYPGGVLKRTASLGNGYIVRSGIGYGYAFGSGPAGLPQVAVFVWPGVKRNHRGAAKRLVAAQVNRAVVCKIGVSKAVRFLSIHHCQVKVYRVVNKHIAVQPHSICAINRH